MFNVIVPLYFQALIQIKGLQDLICKWKQNSEGNSSDKDGQLKEVVVGRREGTWMGMLWLAAGFKKGGTEGY